jgi:hypothetical protein
LGKAGAATETAAASTGRAQGSLGWELDREEGDMMWLDWCFRDRKKTATKVWKKHTHK